MDTKEKQTAEEAAAWETFEAAVGAVPRDRLEAPLLHDGWSVKDVLWHITRWWEDCADTLELLRTGVFGAWDGDTDAENARVLVEGRAMTLEEVEARSAHVRERMLLAWDAAPEDPRGAENFRSETVEHYEEHLPAIRGI